MAPPIYEESVDLCSRESADSSAPATLISDSQTPSFQHQRKISEDKKHPFHASWYTDFCLSLYSLLRKLSVQVHFESATIFFPAKSMQNDYCSSSIVKSFRKGFADKVLPHTVVINLPQIRLCNESQKNNLFLEILDVPVLNLDGWNTGEDLFPWTLNICRASIYTLQDSKEVHPCLLPVIASATIAFTTKCTPPTSDKLSQLGLCIHADMEPLRLSFSDKQVFIMTSVIQHLLHSIGKIKQQNNMNHAALSLKPLYSSESGVHLKTSVPSVSQIEIGEATTLPIIKENCEDVENENKISENISPDDVKVSVWLQWTLPKFTVDLYTSDDNKGVWLSLDIDEIIVSVDVQDIYSKIKLKVASLNCNHYIKDEKTGNWKPGKYEGIIFCSNDKFSREVHIPTSKPDARESLFGVFETIQTRQSDASHYSFLTLTLTKAQCKNVQKRWADFLQETCDENPELSLLNVPVKQQRYISEIDLKIRPFDFVMWSPILIRAINILKPFADLDFPRTIIPAQKVSSSGELSKSSATGINSIENVSLKVNNNTLPLLYISADTIRIFCPDCTSMADVHRKNDMDCEENQESKEDESKSHQSYSIPKNNMNMCIFQIESIVITPQVENPLSRIILRSDIYSLAQQARITNIPGSLVEDRQYQADFTGICLTTGCWEEFIHCSNSETPTSVSSKLHTMGENPALEWNNKILSASESDEESLVFLPIISPFNIRILFAPSVVYECLSTPENICQETVICGHSFEVNVTTDLEFYFRINQMFLLSNVYSSNIYCIFTQSDPNHIISEKNSKVSSMFKQANEVRQDSGIESDISTLKTVGELPSIVQVLPDEDTCIINIPERSSINSASLLNPKNVSFIPYEVLLTAGHISIMLYDVRCEDSKIKGRSIKNKQGLNKRKKVKHRHSEPSVSTYNNGKAFGKRRSDLDWKEKKLTQAFLTPEANDGSSKECKRRKTISLGSDGYEGSEEESLDDGKDVQKNIVESHAAKIIPLLYLKFVQPHTFLKCEETKQKIELSCFDINIRGSPENNLLHVTEEKLFPLPEDYSIIWLETKPGCADTKTGIPPAFSTLTVENFFHLPAVVKLRIERPLKLVFSILKYKELTEILSLLSPVFMGTSLAESEISTEEQDTSFNMSRWRNLGTFIKESNISFVQIIFLIETIPHKENCHIICNVSSINGNVELKNDNLGRIKEAIFGVSCKEFLIKTSLKQKSYFLLGPFSTRLSLVATWEDWNPNTYFPYICLNVENETFILSFGQEILICLKIMFSHFQEFLFETQNDEITYPSNKTNKKKDNSPEIKSKECFHPRQCNDDLRIGTFQYIQDADDVGLQPGPYEIVFCREQAGQPASMTWCYPEPRVLTKVEIYPVPFRAASDITTHSSQDINEEISCVLQYWDPILHSFITYRSFQLSETQQCVLDLPGIIEGINDQLVISNKWRVVLDYIEDENYDEIMHRGLVSPLALAACMRVDSYFNYELVPLFQMRVSFQMIKVIFSNHLQQCGKGVPFFLKPFIFDSTIPIVQDFLFITMEKFSVNSNIRNNLFKIETNCTFKLDVLEYRNLTLLSLIDTFNLRNHVTVSKNAIEQPMIVEVNTLCDPVNLKINQSAVHTVSASAHAWNLCDEKHKEQVLMNHYVICNNTRETIRFGQAGLDENITLLSNHMHAYSWRSHKAKQLLHICVKGMYWKWCEPFSIDVAGVTVRSVEHKGHRVTLIIKVKCLNKLQKKIVIEGRLCLMNSLNKCLEIKLINTVSNTDDAASNFQQFVLEHESLSPTCIIESEQLKSFQIRFKNSNSCWTTEIEFSKKQKFQHKLLEVPTKNDREHINIWCHLLKQQLSFGDQIMIKFSPLFIVQTHMPRSLRLNVTMHGESYSVEIDSRGKEYQLHCAGNIEIPRKLSFQISPHLEPSKPPLPLSINMVPSINKFSPPSVNLEEIIESGLSNDVLWWPYDDDEIESDLGKLPPVCIEYLKRNHKSPSKISVTEINQPNINLEVSLTHKWSHCNTILINLKPWGLIINKCPLQMVLQTPSEDQWILNSMETFASPKLEGHIKFGIKVENDIYFSEELTFTNDDWSFRNYWPRDYDKIPKQGFTQMAILAQQDNRMMLCYITIHSKEKHGIRIIQLQPTFNIINKSNKDFRISLQALRNSGTQVKFLPKNEFHLHLCGFSAENNLSAAPLLFWEIKHDFEDGIFNLNEHVKYICFNSSLEDDPEKWSFPYRLETSQRNARYVVAVPHVDYGTEDSSVPSLTTMPFVLSSHDLNGVVYLVIDVEKHPPVILYNNCTIPLLFGQQLKNFSEGIKIAEELEVLYQLPFVKSKKACHYSFPLVARSFPEIAAPHLYPKLCFAKFNVSEVDLPRDEAPFWSSGLDITLENDLFLNIPGYSDVRIHLEKICHTMHIFIDPVSRIEISAKEVRSRIRSRNQAYSPICSAKTHNFAEVEKIVISLPPEDARVAYPDNISDTANEKSDDEKYSPMGLNSTNKPSRERPRRKKMSVLSKDFYKNNERLYYFTFFAKHMSLVVTNAISDSEEFHEVLRVNGEDIVCALRTVCDTRTKTEKVKLKLIREICLCIGSLQVDNQLSTENNYDFPVILLPQEKYNSLSISQFPLEQILQSVRNNAFFTGEISLESGGDSCEFCIKTIIVSIKPLKLFIEDGFLYKLFDILPTFLPEALHSFNHEEFPHVNNKIPMLLINIASAFHSPIKIHNLLINEMSVMLSVHASLKLFISLDQTPLSFKPFQRSNMLTTSYPLGHALTVHYLSGALIRAGWVVGSLDLIGNPGGFIRAVGSGMSDFVKLPYQGLMKGPWAFLTGVAHGSTSLIQQISAGTLISITNLASSVSRNMEKLSLDETYTQQNKEIRHCKPDSMTRGLTQGLTGFGISLLGAVAGIIDQPLQTFQNAMGQPNFPALAFTGLITGMGKGLVGIITKPLGGAAELVAQAGQGILYGSGWSSLLQVQCKPLNQKSSSFPNSDLKYAWKMLPDLPQVEVILALEATQINNSGNYVPSILLLTSQILFLVNIEEDVQQQAFPLTDIDCIGTLIDPTLIYVIPHACKPDKLTNQHENDNHERVEEFVNKTVKYMMQCQEGVEFNSDSSSQPSPVLLSNGSSLSFYVNPNMRDTFLALFNITKNCIVGRGFIV